MYNRRFGLAPRTLGGFFEDVMQSGLSHLADEAVTFSVPVNIQETEKSYELHVVAPGLKKEDFKINLERNLLTLSFDKVEEKKEEQPEGKWLRTEYRSKSFKRAFTLNEKVDSGKISAKYADGILYVTLPKKEQPEPATLEISVN